MSIPFLQKKSFLDTFKRPFRKKEKPSIEERISDTVQQRLEDSEKQPMQIKKPSQKFTSQAPVTNPNVSHNDQVLGTFVKPSIQIQKTPQKHTSKAHITNNVDSDEKLIEEKPIPLPRSSSTQLRETKPDLLESIKKAKENLKKHSHCDKLPNSESILKKEIKKPIIQKRVSFKEVLDDTSINSPKLPDNAQKELCPPEPPPRSPSTQLSEKKTIRVEEKSELDIEFEKIKIILEECESFLLERS